MTTEVLDVRSSARPLVRSSAASAGPARRLLGLRSVRFALVGSVITAIDFGVFATLTARGLPVFGANAVSASCGLLFSCFANRLFTFGAGRRHDAWGVLLFVAVTGTGLWQVQPLVILGSMALLPSAVPEPASVIVGKIAGIGVGLVRNFVLDKRVVFHQR